MFKSFVKGYTMFKEPAMLSSGHQIFDPVGVTQDQFYGLLAETIRFNQFQNTKISTIWKSEGWFKASRKFLRVEFKDLYFDIVTIEQQYNFVVMWRLFRSPNRGMEMIHAIPKVGDAIKSMKDTNRPEAESITIFKDNIQMCIGSAINQIKNMKISRR